MCEYCAGLALVHSRMHDLCDGLFVHNTNSYLKAKVDFSSGAICDLQGDMYHTSMHRSLHIITYSASLNTAITITVLAYLFKIA